MPTTTTLAAVLTHTTGIMLMPGGGPDPGWTDLQDYVAGIEVDANAPAPHLMSVDRIRKDLDITADLLAQFPRLAEAVPAPGLITSYATAEAWVAAVSRHTGVPMEVEVLSRAEVERAGARHG